MMKTLYLITILFLFVAFGSVNAYGRVQDQNLLQNSNFELGVSDTYWLHEYNTQGVPAFVVTPNGLHLQYTGDSKDTSKCKVEVFQGIYNSMVATNKIRFAVNLSGSSINSPVVIGIEGFDSAGNWINESDIYVTDISNTKKNYQVFYACPDNATAIAVYLQAQEVTQKSSIDLYLSNASCVIEPKGYKEPTNESENIILKNLRLILAIVFLLIPTFILIMEVTVSIKNNLRKYEFSYVNENDYSILVPIYGNIRFLENVEYLKQYGDKVMLCTTGNESESFYKDLQAIATEYSFKVFIDEPNLSYANSNKRMTSGTKRDTIIKHALKHVESFFTVCIDADTTTEKHLSYLVGEVEHKNFDLASIQIVPNNKEASVLTRLQAFEYHTAMNFRFLFPWLLSGACHAGKTNVLINIMNKHSCFFQGNDVETGLLANTLGYKVGHIPFVVLTSVPDNLIDWYRQRIAWSAGEFRLYIMNLGFIIKHPYFWFYGGIVTICLFPLRWLSLFALTVNLYIVLAVYFAMILYLHWKRKNPYILLMPLYTLFQSLVLTPIGILWYFKMSYKDRNYGIIRTK